VKEVAGTGDESDAAQVASSAANIIVPRSGDEAASQERGKRRSRPEIAKQMARILSGICLLLRNPKGLLQSPRPIHGPTVSVRGLF
jgi:hypothetical protein